MWSRANNDDDNDPRSLMNSAALDIMFWSNMFIFMFYTGLVGFVIGKVGLKRLDKVSVWAMTIVWIGFLIRFCNWIVFKVYDFSSEEEKNHYFHTVFFMLDLLGSSIFHLNAYFFSFEIIRVHT